MPGDKTVPRREIYVCCFTRWLYCQTEFQYYVYTHRLVLFYALIREGFFFFYSEQYLKQRLITDQTVKYKSMRHSKIWEYILIFKNEMIIRNDVKLWGKSVNK